MTTRKNCGIKTEARLRRRKSKITNGYALPSQQERLPVYTRGAYQMAMGTREEIIAWLQGVTQNSHAILISFSNETSFKERGPIFWHVARELPEIVGRIRRRRFEQLVDALTQL